MACYSQNHFYFKLLKENVVNNLKLYLGPITTLSGVFLVTNYFLNRKKYKMQNQFDSKYKLQYSRLFNFLFLTFYKI